MSQKHNFTDAEMALINLLISGEEDNVKLAAQLLKPTLKYKSQKAFLERFGYNKLKINKFRDFLHIRDMYITIQNKDYFYLPLPKFDMLSNEIKRLTFLPDISHLKFDCLFCDDMKIKEIPENLPDSILEIHFSNTKIKKLPTKLPNNLLELHIDGNKDIAIQDAILPNSINIFSCNDCEVEALPEKLPNNLKELFCDINDLVCLPVLPPNLEYLTCVGNKRLKLNNINFPKSMKRMYYSHGQLNDEKTKELEAQGVKLILWEENFKQ